MSIGSPDSGGDTAGAGAAEDEDADPEEEAAADEEAAAPRLSGLTATFRVFEEFLFLAVFGGSLELPANTDW